MPITQRALKKRAAIVLGSHPNSATRTLEPLSRLARLMVGDFGRFLCVWLAYRRSGVLDLASWPESRELAGYGHLSWGQYEQAVTPIWAKWRRLWMTDPDLAMEIMLPLLKEASPPPPP